MFQMPYDRSVVVACDVRTLVKLQDIVHATSVLRGIGGYKVGFTLVGRFGLGQVVSVIRSASVVPLPIIYDHQKGGTDIPKMGEEFALLVKESGADAAILFPLAGPAVAERWIQALQAFQDEGVDVIVGGHMTHEKFLESDGGYITNMAPFSIYAIAAQIGVTNFVVPGNKPEYVQVYRRHLEQLGVDTEKLQLFAPGFVTQGGDISETGIVAGNRWHAIIGSEICNKPTKEAMRESASRLVSQINV